MRLSLSHAARLGMLAVLLPFAAPAAAQESAPAVTVAAAQDQRLMQVVPVSGSLIAREEVLVFAHSGGFAITALNAEVGDRITAGAVLAQLDDRTLRLRVTQAQAQLANAEAASRQAESQVSAKDAQLRQANQVLERARALRASGTATQSALDEAETAQLGAEAAAQSALDGVLAARAALQQAQASLDVAQLDYDNARITAPVGGIISERNGQIGAISATGGSRSIASSRMAWSRCRPSVIETELVLLHPGDPATLEIAGLTPITGALRLIAPVVSATTRLGEVRIALDQTEGLRPGLYVGGRITVADRSGLAIPVSAVLRDATGSYVLLLGPDDTLERRNVQTGLAWNGWQEITAGLAAGDAVVARAGAFLTPATSSARCAKGSANEPFHLVDPAPGSADRAVRGAVHRRHGQFLPPAGHRHAQRRPAGGAGPCRRARHGAVGNRLAGDPAHRIRGQRHRRSAPRRGHCPRRHGTTDHPVRNGHQHRPRAERRQGRGDRARANQMPDTTSDPVVQRLDFTGRPILTFAVADQTRSIEELSSICRSTSWPVRCKVLAASAASPDWAVPIAKSASISTPTACWR